LRIDKFLWFTRLTKTRALAAMIAETGHIRIDGRRIDKAHATVKPGDTVTLVLHDRVRVLHIEHLPVRRGPPAEARACYADLPVDGAASQS
jgi:ribosome-associated heat shock protein Hsp15